MAFSFNPSSLIPQTPTAIGNMALNMYLNTLFPGAGMLGSLVEGPLEKALGLTGGAPKQGGYAEVGGTAGGTLDPLYGGTGTDRGYTPNQADAQIQQYLTGLNNSYTGDLSKLGLKMDPATFALGFDTDPGGTAQDRYTGGVSIGGKLLDQAKDVSSGRDASGFNTSLSAYGTSMLNDALAAAGATPAQIASLGANSNQPNTSTPGVSPQNNANVTNMIMAALGSIPGLTGGGGGTGGAGGGAPPTNASSSSSPSFLDSLFGSMGQSGLFGGNAGAGLSNNVQSLVPFLNLGSGIYNAPSQSNNTPWASAATLGQLARMGVA